MTDPRVEAAAAALWALQVPNRGWASADTRSRDRYLRPAENALAAADAAARLTAHGRRPLPF